MEGALSDLRNLLGSGFFCGFNKGGSAGDLWCLCSQTYEVMLTEDGTRAKRQQIDKWDSEPTIVLGRPMIRSIKAASLTATHQVVGQHKFM